MARPYQILLPLLSLFLVRVDLTDLWPLEYEVQVLKILDGDTLLVGLGEKQLKLRLSRVDAPEKGQPFLTGAGDAGEASRDCLRQTLGHISQKRLLIEGRDLYGRTLGDLSGLNLLLIQNGCSGLYAHTKFSSRSEKMRYLYALSKAKNERRGLWQQGGYLNPKLWRKRHK